MLGRVIGMPKNLLFRKILLMLILALFLWSSLTSLVYSKIAGPVFQRIKSEDLFDQAAIISYLAADKDNLVDDELIKAISMSIRFYGTGAYITDRDGAVLLYNVPEDVPDSVLDELNLELKNLLGDVLEQGNRKSLVIPLNQVEQDLLVVAVPIVKQEMGQAVIIGSVIMLKTMQELQASFNSLNIALLISAIIVGLIVVLPIIYMTGRLVKPLEDMQKAAAAMIEGDFSHRLEPVGGDNEISYLINAFNHLSSELDNNISNLINERNQLQHIIDGIAEGIIAVDHEGKVTQDNAMIWTLFHKNSRQHTTDELLKMTGLDELFATCLQDEKIVLVVKQSGSDLINCLISPLLDREGVLFGAVGLFRDVTESEKLEQTRHEYVSNVSHELRTPVTAMRGLLEPLNDGLVKSEEQKKRYYAILLRETIRLSNLIDDMLELSRIQTSEKTTNLGPVNLQNDLFDLAIRFGVLAEQKNIKFTAEGLHEAYPAVWGKADRILQILSALMENAVKFTEEGGKIKMLVKAEESCLSISIVDSGCGIKSEDIPYVFERFYKADKSHNEHGTGLGLSIASELAQQMGHSLSVTSSPGQGSSFTLSMPYARDIMKSEPHLKDVYESETDHEGDSDEAE